jgi:TRAP-type mannitol/chloroaromatic compound transport system permease large subunit
VVEGSGSAGPVMAVGMGVGVAVGKKLVNWQAIREATRTTRTTDKVIFLFIQISILKFKRLNTKDYILEL